MISSTQFTVSCPSCLSEFPIDPEKVPDEGVHAICSACLRVFPVLHPADRDADRWKADGKPDLEGDSVVDPGFDEDRESELHVSSVTVGPIAPEPLIEEADDEVSEPQEVDEPAELSEPLAPTAETHVEEEPQPFEDLTSLAAEALAESDDPLHGASGGSPVGSLSVGASRFGSRDPHERARRLARVLVSDIIAYYPTRYRQSLSRGTLKEDFGEEVQKSWREFVDQVGEELAESTPYFNDALNEILAKGEDVF